jgi:hypothetical protein
MNYRNLVALLCALFAFVLVNKLFAQPTLEFSHEHGFYNASFQLEIKSTPANGKIRYTFDGSDPRKTSNAITVVSPATITINPYISNGRAVTAGVIVRACSITGADTSKTYTQSYIFLSEVKYQKNVSSDLLPYWPDQPYMPSTYSPNLVDWMQNMSNYQLIKLNVDPEVIYPEEIANRFEQDLLSIPSFSMVTDPENLFADSTGIYCNGTWSGIAWERPASLELINPLSDEGFQVNTGIRIRGGWSSTGADPKHAFRLYFREEYGNSKLTYPLFGTDGTDEFDKIDLRCEQNNSWNAGNSSADYIHDAFSREIQGEMKQPYTRSRYYHLYLNGMYWGLYETQERASADFAESYMGGDNDDYDVVKSSAGSIDYPPYTLEATDGDLNSSKALWDIAIKGFTHDNYYKSMGLNPDGSVNPEYPKYLDVDNLISYMMIIYFSANRDGPASLSQYDIRINNFFGIFNREKPDGFKYCIHDNETAYGQVNDNITNEPFIAGSTFESFNPMWLNRQLLENADYKQRFADLAYRYLNKDGILSPERNISRFQTRVEMIDEAIVGESARWGGRYLSKERTWLTAINRMQQTFFPQRSQIVIDQFKAMGWMNNLIPPAIDSSEVIIGETQILSKTGNLSLINKNGSGVIYYSTDNCDPRSSGGAIDEKAIIYSSPIPVQKTTFLKARIKDGELWSPLLELVVMKNEGTGLLISEINYNPCKQVIVNDTLADRLEFIEIKNTTKSDIDISGFTLSEGIRFEFPLNSLIKADSLLVLASDTTSFRKVYGFYPLGQFDGNLNNKSEKIILKNPCGAKISEINYNNDGVWLKATDGAGYTLVPINLTVDQLADDKSNWRTSTNWLGSPGKDDPNYTPPSVVIYEVLANSKKPQVDFIELKNNGNSVIDVSNWFLSDEKDQPDKWKIPHGTTIQPGGVLIFYEGHYVADSMQFSSAEFGSSFSLSKGGETIYLYSSDNDKPENFITDYSFGATDENVTFGSFTNVSGTELQLQLKASTPGAQNGDARLSPLVFKTIMYHPVDGNYEFLVLKNRSDSTLNLYYEIDNTITWKVEGIDFDFPANTSVKPGDSIFIIEKILASEAFRAVEKLPSTAQIFTYAGKLSNGGESIAIERPILVESDSSTDIEYITLEEINFNDKKPWPKNADGEGFALTRIDENAFGNDATNWTSEIHVIPVAIAGNNSRVRFNSSVILDGSGSYDPSSLALTYNWKLESKPADSKASLANSHIVSPSFTCDKEGNYLFSLKVSNGKKQSAPAYVSVFAIPNTTPVTENYTRTYKIKLDQTLSLGAYDSFDAEYDSLGCLWSLIEKPEGSSYTFDDFTGRSFNFKADIIGNYRFNLIANDGELTGRSVPIKIVVSAPTGIISNKTKNGIKVYPNPVVAEAYTEFNLEKESAATIQVTSVTGQAIVNANLGILRAGNHVVPINFNGQKSGVYLITIKTKDFIRNTKVYFMP